MCVALHDRPGVDSITRRVCVWPHIRVRVCVCVPFGCQFPVSAFELQKQGELA